MTTHLIAGLTPQDGQSTAPSHSADGRRDRRQLALLVLAASEFMVVLDSSIVNIALPQVSSALHLSGTALAWVITAYVVTFGALLPLGGRIADLVGRRRVFLIGTGLFSLSSLAAGLATNAATLITTRAAQGVGAALLAPAATALVTAMFPEARERARALGVWGAVAGAGGAAGVLFGGVLTGAFGWRSIFLVNVPIGLAIVVTVPFLLEESRARRTHRLGRADVDLAGAVTITGALIALVVATSQGHSWGWSSTSTVALLASAVALLGTFLYFEHRAPAPLIPLRLLGIRTVATGNLIMFATSAAMAGMFYFLSLYQQQILHYSAIAAGLSQLPAAFALVAGAMIAPVLASRLGLRGVTASALLLLAAGMAWLAAAPTDGTFAVDILGPSVLVGLGLGAAFVLTTAVAVAGVGSDDAGVAGGLVNASRQIGVAIGIAALATLALHHTAAAVASGTTPMTALADGFSKAFVAAALIALLGAGLALLKLRHDDASEVALL